MGGQLTQLMGSMLCGIATIPPNLWAVKTMVRHTAHLLKGFQKCRIL